MQTSKPGWIKVVRSFQPDLHRPELVVPAGTTLPVYTYLGRECWRAWVDDALRTLCLTEETRMTARPTSEWWVKVQDSSDRTGWARCNGNFGNNNQHR